MNIKLICMSLALVLVSALSPGAANAGDSSDPRKLLARYFRSSEQVTFVRVALDDAEKRGIEKRLGRRLRSSQYTFFVARTGSRIDGYALFDAERGQHELIDLAFFFDARGTVTGIEVVKYREAYGDQIRSARFRRQFYGRTSESSFRVGDGIDIVSGATISSRAVARAAERASVLVQETLITKNVAKLQASR